MADFPELPTCSITAGAVQGARDYFEDRIDVRVRHNHETPFVYGAVFDGHGGPCASTMAQTRMFDILQKSPHFASTNRQKFADSVAAGFKQLHQEMKIASPGWTMKRGIPRDGTTASVAVMTSSYLMLANVGDSPIYIVTRDENNELEAVHGVKLHSPDYKPDHARIISAGGIVTNFKGTGGVRRVTPNPGQFNAYLRMTRSLGDFWMNDIVPGAAGDSVIDPKKSILSHHPMVYFYDIKNLAYVIIASDGCFLKPKTVAKVLTKMEEDEQEADDKNAQPMNPAQRIVGKVFEVREDNPTFNYDNISVVGIRIHNSQRFDQVVPIEATSDTIHLTPKFVEDDSTHFHLDGPTITTSTTETPTYYSNFKNEKQVITYG